MGQQGNIRRHAGEAQVFAVILAGTDSVVEVVVLPAQRFPALRVFPYPAFERFTHHILPLLGKDGFFSVQRSYLSSNFVLDRIINAAVPQV